MSVPVSLRRLLPDFRGLPRPFWVLFAGTLVNRVGGFVLIFLAIYLTEARGLSAGQAGMALSAYGLGAIAGAPFGGTLSDRIGRRPTLAASLIAGGASMLILGTVTGTPAIIAAAALTGVLYEMYRPVVSATIADVVRADDRPRAYSLIYWAVNLGGAIAPLLGGFLAARSYRLFFVADAATTALYGVIVWLALPETRPPEPAAISRPRNAAAVILGDRVFVTVCVLTFLFSLVFFQVFVALPIDVRAHGISPAGFGSLIAINGVLIVFLQPLAGDVIRGRSQPLTLAAASLLLGIGFGMNACVGSIPAYLVSVTIWTLGEIAFAAASPTLVADLAPGHLRGAYQGSFAVAYTGAFAAAPLIGGYVIAHAGATTLWLACLMIGVLVGAAFIGLGRHARFTGVRAVATTDQT